MSNPGLWEFPGGKVENNETDEDALKREIHEELGIVINAKKKLMSVHSTLPSGKAIELIAYFAEWESGEIDLKEHEQTVFAEINEAFKLDWSSADIPILERLREEIIAN